MPNFTVSLTITAAHPGYNLLASGTYAGSLQTDEVAVATIANGGITVFNILVATDPEVTDPSPDALFDFVAAGTDVSYDTVSGTLTIGGPAPSATIVSDTNPMAPVPIDIFLSLGSTIMGSDAAADVGVYASGTWKFTPLGNVAVINCAIDIVGVGRAATGGGGSAGGGRGCPVINWCAASKGQLWLNRGDGFYRSKCGDIYRWKLDPCADTVLQMARHIAETEGYSMQKAQQIVVGLLRRRVM